MTRFPWIYCLYALLLFSSSNDAKAWQTGPELFAEGLLNTERDEYSPVFSKDGNTLYYTIRQNRRGAESIVVTKRNGNSWTRPETLPFSGNGFDKEPYLSPDGSRLFFASKRPVPSGEDLDFELWVVERSAQGWGAPKHLAAVGSPAYDNYPAVAANGNLYFGSARVGGRGRLHRAVWNGQGYNEPEMLMINGKPLGGADPYIDSEERFMIFSSTRSGGYGEGDLYYTQNDNGSWTEPINLGPVVNTATYEYTPFISADRAYLYFSRGWGEMWRISLSELELKGLE